MAELADAPDLGSGVYDVGVQVPLPAPYAQIAQSVEQWTENPRVGGSIPPLGTIDKAVYTMCRQLYCYMQKFQRK